MPKAGVWTEISQGNVSHDHIYLRKVIDYFPADAIGGSNAADASAHPIKVVFSNGCSAVTDIDGDKLFLRCRSEVRKFFEDQKAKPGDLVIITKLEDRVFSFDVVAT